MEYVYELNLPPAREIYLESFGGFGDEAQVFNYQHIEEGITDIIKPEWLAFAGYKWDQLLYFKKNNFEGRIHTDIGRNTREDFNPWGISWVYEGDGLIEYWNLEDLNEEGISLGSFNRKSGKVNVYTPNTPPRKSYPMFKDKVYLVYGKQPHKATGYANRKILNLRSWEISYEPWEKIVGIFEKYMVPGQL